MLPMKSQGLQGPPGAMLSAAGWVRSSCVRLGLSSEHQEAGPRLGFSRGDSRTQRVEMKGAAFPGGTQRFHSAS